MSKPKEPWKLVGSDNGPMDAYDTAPAGTRFLMCGYDAYPREFTSGDWVRYTDYEKLKAENERLRKAGDAMASALNGDYNHELDCVKDWQDAKQPPTDPTK